MGKNKDVILPESMDDTTSANQMANFFMNKIHEISGAQESYDKFKPLEKNIDKTLEIVGNCEVKESKN